jgi:hypothetical protein
MGHLKIIFTFILSLVMNLAIGQTADKQADKNNENDKLSSKNKVKVRGDNMFNLDILGCTDLPMADMAKRFGLSYRLGLSIKYKMSSNWIFGVKGELITGNNIREDSLMSNLQTSQGGVISQIGEVLNVGVFERGYLIGIQVGKIFPVLQMNRNSGPMTLFSVGFIQHKIKLFDQDNSFPQLRDEYVKGYDRLTNGGYIENFSGYAFYAKNKLINFYAGLNLIYGYTKGRREFLYDVGRKDDQRRSDVLLGFKLGWVVPIYKKMVEETYY